MYKGMMVGTVNIVGIRPTAAVGVFIADLDERWLFYRHKQGKF